MTATQRGRWKYRWWHRLAGHRVQGDFCVTCICAWNYQRGCLA
ncbi:hypothetical protein [Rhodococcoides fascians]|nr:hypothetical protein [Rhodococcus fascians]